MIQLTDNAGEKVRAIREEEDLGDQGLRIKVVGGGCAGFSYDLYFEDETMSLQYLSGTTIDYVEGLHGAGFKFLNPSAKSTCGCGSSFSA